MSLKILKNLNLIKGIIIYILVIYTAEYIYIFFKDLILVYKSHEVAEKSFSVSDYRYGIIYLYFYNIYAARAKVFRKL